MVCERADDARCGLHRWWPQRSCLLRLSGDGRSQGIGARSGGAAVTEEFSPGFRNSVASYAVSLLNPKIIRDLDLAVHGLRIVDRPVSNFLPLGAGSFLKVCGSRTKREVAKFSTRDADRLDDYRRRLVAVADILRASVLETPPNVVEGSPFSAIAELFKADRIANRIRALGLDLQRDLLDLFAASAGDFLDGWFESAPIKAAFGFDMSLAIMRAPTRRARPMFSCTIASAR
jgi:phytoene dehydrogenase-like protein